MLSAWIEGARWRRPALLGVLLVGLIAVVSSPGDIFRMTRATWLTGEPTRLAAGGLGAWALCALLSTSMWGRRPRSWNRWWRIVPPLVALPVGGLGVLLAVRAIQTWGVRLDAPVVLYPAHLVFQRGYIPYRDIVDFNQPGTYLLYGCIDVIARSDFALRVVDTFALVLTVLASRRAFALPGWSAAFIGAGLYTVTHMEDTGVDCLQREVFVLALTVSSAALMRMGRYIAAGLVFGLCFWMKFHSVLLMLPFVWDVIRRNGGTRAGWVALGKMAAVVASISVAVVTLLVVSGAFPAWLELVTQYLPLYGRMAGTLGFSGMELLRYRRLFLFFNPTHHPAILGLLLVPPLLTTARARLGVGPDAVRVVVGFYLCTLAYVLVQGTFWHYHSIPSCFAIGMMVGLLISEPRDMIEGLGRLAVSLAVGWHCMGPHAFDTMHWESNGRNEDGMAIANQLEIELPPGELVQPLDIVQGVVDGMRRADVPLATPFMYDLYFYHDVQSPIIQRWRHRMLADMEERRPYFVIEALPGRAVRPYGEGTDEHFPELEQFLAEHYVVHRDTNGIRWWRRRDYSQRPIDMPP